MKKTISTIVCPVCDGETTPCHLCEGLGKVELDSAVLQRYKRVLVPHNPFQKPILDKIHLRETTARGQDR